MKSKIKNQKSKMFCLLAVLFGGVLSHLYGMDAQQITLTTISPHVHLRGAFAQEHSDAQATVDWGDGTKDFVKSGSLKGNAFWANHQYLGEAPRTITIRATFLTDFDCSDNQVMALDVSKNTILTDLQCSDNQLVALNVRNNTTLTVLHCSDNQLAALDVSNNLALTHLRCSNNQLTNLDVRGNITLSVLQCSGNQLVALNVSNNTALTVLWCAENQLTELNVCSNTTLNELYCDNNQFTALDVCSNTALVELLCNKNRLTTLDVSHNKALTFLWCHDNQLSATALNVLYRDLPVRSGKDGKLRSYSNPKYTTVDKSIAEKKGWEVIEKLAVDN